MSYKPYRSTVDWDGVALALQQLKEFSKPTELDTHYLRLAADREKMNMANDHDREMAIDARKWEKVKRNEDQGWDLVKDNIVDARKTYNENQGKIEELQNNIIEMNANAKSLIPEHKSKEFKSIFKDLEIDGISSAIKVNDAIEENIAGQITRLSNLQSINRNMQSGSQAAIGKSQMYRVYSTDGDAVNPMFSELQGRKNASGEDLYSVTEDGEQRYIEVANWDIDGDNVTSIEESRLALDNLEKEFSRNDEKREGFRLGFESTFDRDKLQKLNTELEQGTLNLSKTEEQINTSKANQIIATSKEGRAVTKEGRDVAKEGRDIEKEGRDVAKEGRDIETHGLKKITHEMSVNEHKQTWGYADENGKWVPGQKERRLVISEDEAERVALMFPLNEANLQLRNQLHSKELNIKEVSVASALSYVKNIDNLQKQYSEQHGSDADYPMEKEGWKVYDGMKKILIENDSAHKLLPLDYEADESDWAYLLPGISTGEGSPGDASWVDFIQDNNGLDIDRESEKKGKERLAAIKKYPPVHDAMQRLVYWNYVTDKPREYKMIFDKMKRLLAMSDAEFETALSKFK